MAQYGSPSQRGVAPSTRIWVAHVYPFYQTLHQEQVVFYAHLISGNRESNSRPNRQVPLTARLSLAEASFSAMVVVRERSDWTRRTRAVRRYYWFCPTLHLDPRRDRCSRATYVLQHRNDLDAGRSLPVTISDSFENSLSIASGPLKAHIHFILHH